MQRTSQAHPYPACQWHRQQQDSSTSVLPFCFCFLPWQNPRGLGKEREDVPRYLEASSFLWSWVNLLLLELEERGVEQPWNKVWQLGSFRSRFSSLLEILIHGNNLYNKKLFGAALNRYHHFTHSSCHFAVYSHFLQFSFSDHLASHKIKRPNCCTLKCFHYSREVSRSLITMQIGSDFYLEKTRRFILDQIAGVKITFFSLCEIAQSLLDCRFCSGCLIQFKVLY